MAGYVGQAEPLDIRQGQTCAISLTVLDEAGAAVNLTGATVRGAIVSTNPTGVGEAATTLLFTSTVINAATGRVDISLTPVQTATLQSSGSVRGSAQALEWLVEVTDASSRTVTLAYGPVRVWGGG